MDLRVRKSRCLDCGRVFRQQLPGVQPCESQRELPGDGLSAAPGRREPKLFGQTQGHRSRHGAALLSAAPATPAGRSEAALESYLVNLQGKLGVRIVCMDLAVVYRSIVRKHFPQALIVADRFHVIRLINHHFLLAGDRRGRLQKPRATLADATPSAQSQARAAGAPVAYLAQRPALELIYRFQQRLCYLLLKKHKTRRQCEKLAPRFLRAVVGLRQSGLAQLITLGETLHSWSEEIARMWRFTRSNGITEGFHNKMETLNRQAYGFRNFENYRLRVKVLCS
jgi:transposase